MTEAVILSPETIEALALELADQLERRRLERSSWVTANGVAEHLGIERDWVYAHASELGAVRLGTGDRGRLRFQLARVDELLAARAPCLAGMASAESRIAASPQNRRPRQRSRGDGEVELLPVRGAAR